MSEKKPTRFMITYDDILLCPKFYTEELMKKRTELDAEFDRLWNEGAEATRKKQEGKTTEEIIAEWNSDNLDPDRQARVKQWEEWRRQKDILSSAVEKNYLQLRSKDEIISDVKLVVNSMSKTDYTDYIGGIIAEILTYRELGSNEEYCRDIEKRLGKILIEGYEGCFQYILSYLDIPLRYFVNNEAYTKKIIDIVKARVGLWYTEPEPNYLPVVNGRAIEAIAKIATKSSLLKVDPISKTGSVTIGEGDTAVHAVLKKLDEYRDRLKISTDKLLEVALASFTNNNHIGEESRVLQTTQVYIPLKDYARSRGFKIDPRPTSTPEEAKKEANRAKVLLHKVRKQTEKDLESLATTPLSWKEKVKGKDKDFLDVYLIDAKGIQDGYIFLNFSQKFAEYLIQLPINQYPVALLGLDGKKPTAYILGKKLAFHYFMDSNQLHHRAQLLKVKTLLKETDLPTLEEVKKSANGWEWRIKEPFEEAMEALVKAGVLEEETGWYYCHTKGVRLSDEEAQHIDSYEEWTNLLIKFTLKDAPDQTERLDKKRQKIEEAKAKKDKQASKKKSSSSKEAQKTTQS